MIKLIASDLDGTLLRGGAQRLEPEIYDLIRRLRQRGVLFVAASGRQYANMRRLFEPVKDEILYLCENGALVVDGKELVYRQTIEREVGQEILRAIRRRERCEILLSGADTSYIQPKQESYLVHVRDVLRNNCTVVEDILTVEEEYLKISVFEDDGVENCEAYFKEQFSDRVKVVTSGYDWLDMVAKGVDKGRALQKLLERYGIRPEECAAFGDNYNDVEMLRQAGCSFAVEGAKPEVKELCRYQTDTVEHALERLLEGEMDDVRI